MQVVNRKELENRFGFHPATKDTIPLHENIRAHFYKTALWLNETLPDSREKSLAFTALQETTMWANAAVACNLAPLEPISTNIDN